MSKRGFDDKQFRRIVINTKKQSNGRELINMLKTIEGAQIYSHDRVCYEVIVPRKESIYVSEVKGVHFSAKKEFTSKLKGFWEKNNNDIEVKVLDGKKKK